jgi:ZIP family zinc transporter
MLVGVIALKLVPESIGDYSEQGLMVGLIIAVFFISGADYFVQRIFHIQSEHGRGNRVFAFFSLVLAVSFHNIPTGLAIGSSVNMETLNNSPLLVAIFLHHVPEGLALMISALLAGFNLNILGCRHQCIAFDLFCQFVVIGKYA